VTSGEAPAHGEGTPWGEVKLGDIISAGLLCPPVELFKRYKGQDLHARIESDGRVSFGGQVYGSLSVAGTMARRTVIGADQRAQTNGWAFWRYRTDDGEWRAIDGLRKQLWENRSTSP
jgi:Restriction Enzyme Adenine Methylase Associated